MSSRVAVVYAATHGGRSNGTARGRAPSRLKLVSFPSRSRAGWDRQQGWRSGDCRPGADNRRVASPAGEVAINLLLPALSTWVGAYREQFERCLATVQVGQRGDQYVKAVEDVKALIARARWGAGQESGAASSLRWKPRWPSSASKT